ncbi:MAG: extracellular solute-binding protein [Acidimicrobiales bacterium]
MQVLRRRGIRWLALMVGMAVLVSCSGSGDDGDDGGESAGGGNRPPSDCVAVDIVVSSEKTDLMTALGEEFNRSGATTADGSCIEVWTATMASGQATTRLAEGWDIDADGPAPVIWSPASSTWGAVLGQRTGGTPLVTDGVPMMVTPLVIAMPRPMAEALGWPEEPLGWGDVLALATNPEGWAAYGHPEWGAFHLGKTNPNFSTSGLSALIAQNYAAVGSTTDLAASDLLRPEVVEYARGVESSVVHYGPTTLTFLNNWYRADQRGAALSYVSAVAVEEKSVIDYNRGNPDGVTEPGEEPRPPRDQLVAIYPEEGTLYSDNPLYIVDADWVDEAQAEAAQVYIDFLQQPDVQERALEYGFRPGNPEVPLGAPIDPAEGVDPNEPTTLLPVPEPAVVTALIDAWEQQRRPSTITLLVDVSGSMGEIADPDTGATKLDLAKEAVLSSLDLVSPTDQIRIVTFTTDTTGAEPIITELVPAGAVGDQRAVIEQRVDGLVPVAGTPLYIALSDVFATASASYDPARINGIVVLSDGLNEDGDFNDDAPQLQALIETLSASSEGVGARPVRVFPVAYGGDADRLVLEAIADASAAEVYEATDPRTIQQVFADVISNF